ncbi:MAG: hypothetical protein K8I00_11200, partial [Candidatus Omnitrophica bacterium]|nr:hypothetical protein [Candidatus Omnitrophota bacterium]
VIPNPRGNKAYMMWQPGGLTKTLQTMMPDVSKMALRAEMRGGHVALLDDHVGSGAKMKTFHRLFTSEYGATPVMGALVAVRPRLKHIGPMEEFGEFEVVAGVLDASLVEKISEYATSMSDTWFETRPYQEGSNISDPFVEAVRARINRSDEALLNNPGGIDLNPNGLRMTVSGDAAPLIAPVTGLETVPEVDGYVPVILNIFPTTNLPLLLGQDKAQAPPALAAVRPPSARP